MAHTADSIFHISLAPQGPARRSGPTYGLLMIRKPETIAFWAGRLPHWEVEGGRYFITIHLTGAIPAAGRDRLRATAEQLCRSTQRDAPDWLRLQRMIFAEMERWLDRAEKTAHLAQPAVAEMLIEAIEHRQANGDWDVFEYVVMPNHLHLFCEIGRSGLKETLEGFKTWTGRRAAEILGTDGERFWQREWFDHWSRSDAEDDRIARYIRKNPEKAGLVAKFADWPYGSWRCRSRRLGGTLGAAAARNQRDIDSSD